jgi:3-oxoacyl-[acyl-carrier protein] reductase
MTEVKKIALITGATRGIGKAIAITLANSGYQVIGTATSAAGAMAISNYLGAENGRGVVLDVKNKDNIEAVIQDIAQNEGEVSILVNNAGITKDSLLLRMKEEDWDAVLDTNLKSVFLLVKAVVRGMSKARFGRIINVASVVGFMGNAGQINYSAAKGAMIAMTKSIAKEFGGRNITANCVAPGFIQTEMTDKLSNELKEYYIKNIPLGRFGQVEDIANAVKYLASPEASYITGTTIHVNGGLYV